MEKEVEAVRVELAAELAIGLNVNNRIIKVNAALLNWKGFKLGPRYFFPMYILCIAI